MKAFVFPGQGAQFPGMGKDLYESNPKAKELFDKAGATDVLRKPVKKEEYTICEYTYGKRLLLKQHPVLKKYLDREMQIKESVFQQLFKHQNSASAAERMEELKQEIILTQEALKYYE